MISCRQHGASRGHNACYLCLLALSCPMTARRNNVNDSGRARALVPLMCVDKRPEELGSFSELVQESRQFGRQWGIVFAAAMSGVSNLAPTSEEAEAPLQSMVEAIKRGEHGNFIPFDQNGQPVQFG